MASPLLARLIRMGGGKLLDTAVERVLPAGKVGKIGGGIAGAALARIATKSVPGAIVIGGGIVAKMLYDRRHAKSAEAPAAPAVQDDPDNVIG